MGKITPRLVRQAFGILTFALISLALMPGIINAQSDTTCLQCHKDKSAELAKSAHADVSCTGCHSDINSYPHSNVQPFSKQKEVATCSKCHEGTVTESYAESYHGKAVTLGSKNAASCVNCHGTHSVLGQAQPASKVAKANLSQTCGSCHGKASPGFAEGKEHFKLEAQGAGAPMFYTSKFFVWLTIITITALIIHIELQLYHNLRTILMERKRR